jgi:hypothetical protein
MVGQSPTASRLKRTRVGRANERAIGEEQTPLDNPRDLTVAEDARVGHVTPEEDGDGTPTLRHRFPLRGATP